MISSWIMLQNIFSNWSDIMKAYEINVKLNKFEFPTSRHILIPQGVTFSKLNDILRLSFGFDAFRTYSFSVDGLNVEITDPRLSDSFKIDSRETYIDNYFKLFKKIDYRYHFTENWMFTIKIRKAVDVDFDYAKILDFEGEFNLLEGFFGPYYVEELICSYYHPEQLDESRFDLNDLEKFDLDETNNKLKGL